MSQITTIKATFDRKCLLWSDDKDRNLLLLKQLQHYCNDRFRYEGSIALKDIFMELGLLLPASYYDCVWNYEEHDYIDFGIYDNLKNILENDTSVIELEIGLYSLI